MFLFSIFKRKQEITQNYKQLRDLEMLIWILYDTERHKDTNLTKIELLLVFILFKLENIIKSHRELLIKIIQDNKEFKFIRFRGKKLPFLKQTEKNWI